MPDYTKAASASFTLAAVAASPRDYTKAASASFVLAATAAGLGPREARVAIGFAVTADVQVRLPPSDGRLGTVLRTGLSGRHPFYFAEAADGVVLITNGIDPMLRWDGSGLSAEVAGVPAPATGPSILVVGGIVSTSSYLAFVRFVDRRGNVSDLSPISDAALGYTHLPRVTYTGVEVPTGAAAGKVQRRQLLRNTLGQADTFYVDVDTFDLTSTTFVSEKTDTELSGGEPVPLTDDLGDPLANTHGFPPGHKAVVVAHLGRMFAAVEVAYREGHVAVTAGVATVAGVATDWPANFVGRRLYVPAAPASYKIVAVDVAAQVLTLAGDYQGPTDLFALYAIKAAPGDRKLVMYTPAGEPESWPATYAFGVQEDGDEVTGLMAMSSFLYILERRHIYRFTFKDNPEKDGGIFLTSGRGCVNGRLWVIAEDAAYMLDEMGVHSFSGGESTPISAPIQDLFRDDTDSPLRLDWTVDPSLWHASYSEVHATIRFFVAMTGSRFPRHALCYNYRAKRWWIEEYTRPATSSCRGRIGTVRAFAGTDHRELLSLDVGHADGPRDPTATLRGTATASTPLSLTDALARFTPDMVNAPLHLVSGRGKGQWRRVVAVSATRLEVDRPWLVAPDAETGYAVGGIGWEWRGGTFRHADPENSLPRDVELVYQPNDAGTMDLRLYYDHADEPRTWSASRDGVAVVAAGESAVVVNLADPRGRADHRLDGHLERNVAGDRYVAAELSGVQVGEPVRVYRVTLNGVEPEG
jgi:hypothetical protein